MPHRYELAELNIPENSEYHRLLQRCPDIQSLRFDEGEHLIERGETSKEIFIVLRGSCVVEQPGGDSGQQAPKPLAVVASADASAPSFVGEMAYLGGGLRTAAVRASEPTYTLRLTPEHLNVVTEEFPLFTRILCKQFAHRLRETNEALRESRELFAMAAKRLTKEAGEILFKKGDAADLLYQLIEGSLLRETDGVFTPIAKEDLFFGFLDPCPYFCDGRNDSTVKVKTPAIVLAIAKSSKFAVIRTLPQLILKCLC